jgi:hypothetical protein
MNRTKFLLSHINVMNILLIVVLMFLVNYMLLPLLNTGIHYSLPTVVKHEKPESGADNKTELTKTPSPFDYALIAEQNLFHPERKIPAKEIDAQALPKPDFVLYGTLKSGDINIAYMEDRRSPYATAGRGKRQKALKLGHSMSGFVLTDIQHDKVVMGRGEEKIEVNLINPQHKKERKIEMIQK